MGERKRRNETEEPIKRKNLVKGKTTRTCNVTRIQSACKLGHLTGGLKGGTLTEGFQVFLGEAYGRVP